MNKNIQKKGWENFPLAIKKMKGEMSQFDLPYTVYG